MVTEELKFVRVAVLALDGVEQAEITEPVAAMRAAGAKVEIISMQDGALQMFDHHNPTGSISVDRRFADASPDDYDALYLPGGALNADALRIVPAAQAFAAAFDIADKPIAAICHAAWLLISADLLEGRTLTSFNTIHDDIENAGGIWVDEPVVSDGNLLTSRQPADIPQFNARMLAHFATARRTPELELS